MLKYTNTLLGVSTKKESNKTTCLINSIGTSEKGIDIANCIGTGACLTRECVILGLAQDVINLHVHVHLIVVGSRRSFEATVLAVANVGSAKIFLDVGKCLFRVLSAVKMVVVMMIASMGIIVVVVIMIMLMIIVIVNHHENAGASILVKGQMRNLGLNFVMSMTMSWGCAFRGVVTLPIRGRELIGRHCESLR